MLSADRSGRAEAMTETWPRRANQSTMVSACSAQSAVAPRFGAAAARAPLELLHEGRPGHARSELQRDRRFGDDANLKFSMIGGWEGSIMIAEPDKPAVSVRVKFEVK